jgi:hypothetical protein
MTVIKRNGSLALSLYSLLLVLFVLHRLIVIGKHSTTYIYTINCFVASEFVLHSEARGGRECYYMQEWYIVFPLAVIGSINNAKLAKQIKNVNDTYAIGREMQYTTRMFMTCICKCSFGPSMASPSLLILS